MHRKKNVRKWGEERAGGRTRLPRLLRGSYPRRPVPRCWRAECGGLRAFGYREGDAYHWETAAAGTSGVVQVVIGIRSDGFLWRDSTGEVLFFFGINPYGFPLDSALLAGFCWLAEAEVEGWRTVTGYVEGTELYYRAVVGSSAPTTFAVSDGVRIETDPAGRVRFHRGTNGFPLPLVCALQLGWCQSAVASAPTASQRFVGSNTQANTSGSPEAAGYRVTTSR